MTLHCSMSAHIVPQAELPLLLPWLKKAFPTSFIVYGGLQSAVAGKWPGTEFVVDKWPDPTAILARTDPSGESPCKGFLENEIMGVYGESNEALANLLKLPGMIDWNSTWIFWGVAEAFYAVLQSTAEEKGGKCIFYDKCFLLTATPEDIKPLPVPEGMKLISVTEDLVPRVNSTWKFARKNSADFIRALVRNFPSVALQTESGQHVGHMIGQSYGAIGTLYVEPEFRGQGFAKVMITNLAQKYFDLNSDVYVIIEGDNERSMRLHQTTGFRVVPDMTFLWIRYIPKKDSE